MTIHSVAGSQINVREQDKARTEPRTNSVWRGARFEDLMAVVASVGVLGGTYLLLSQVVLPMMAKGFVSIGTGF